MLGIPLVAALLTPWIFYRCLKFSMGRPVGIFAGLCLQPTVLGYALEQPRNELPIIGYATVFPIAASGKLLLAQLPFIFLRWRPSSRAVDRDEIHAASAGIGRVSVSLKLDR